MAQELLFSSRVAKIVLREKIMVQARLAAEKQKCTVIESFHGEVKLIKRANPFQPRLVTLNFSNLKDCLDYVSENNFEISVVHSGKAKNNHP